MAAVDGMGLAVLAARRSGRVATAYCVGAVLVRTATGDVIATGFSREIPGNTHAEECCLIKLIEAAEERAGTGDGTGAGTGAGTEGRTEERAEGRAEERAEGRAEERTEERTGAATGTGTDAGSVRGPVPPTAPGPVAAQAQANAPAQVPDQAHVPAPVNVHPLSLSASASLSSPLLLSPSASALEPSGPPLDVSGLDLSDCTMYTTMEPCSLRLSGKMPCAVHLIRARIGRVVVGTREPPTFVAECQGIRMLREAGIPVDLDTRYEAECLAINAHVLSQ